MLTSLFTAAFACLFVASSMVFAVSEFLLLPCLLALAAVLLKTVDLATLIATSGMIFGFANDLASQQEKEIPQQQQHR